MTVTAAEFNVAIEGLADRTRVLVPDVQVFSAVGSPSWTKPDFALWVEIVLIDGGRSGANVAFGCFGGGGGGAAGARLRRVVRAADLPDTLSLTVPAAGATALITGTNVNIATGASYGAATSNPPNGAGAAGTCTVSQQETWGSNGGAGGALGSGGTTGGVGYIAAGGNWGTAGSGTAPGNGGQGGRGYGAGGGGAGGSSNGSSANPGGGGGGASGYGTIALAGAGATGVVGSGTAAGGSGAQGLIIITTWRGQ